MKILLLFLICYMWCLRVPLKVYCEQSNDELIELFYFAAERGDSKLINDVIQAILEQENSNEILLDTLAKYNEKGKIDFALHNAIKDKNTLASIILAYYAKDVNTKKEKESLSYMSNAACYHREYVYRDSKTPIELTLEADIKGLITYLLMKKANPYHLREVSFVSGDEEEDDDVRCFASNSRWSFSLLKTLKISSRSPDIKTVLLVKSSEFERFLGKIA